MVKKILDFFNKNILSPKDSVDLSEWRNWLADAIFYCGIILIPFATLFIVPTFLEEKQYVLLFIDISVCSVFILRAFIKSRGYKFWGVCWLVIIYIMTISFYIQLGPHYARSAWLVMATVMAALFFGLKGALITSLLNPIILFGFYFFIGPESTIWSQVHEDTFLKYISFIINTSSIALVTGLLVGFLLDHLEISYQKQKLINEKLNESEKRYRLIAENVADVIWTTDMNLAFTYVSSSIYQQRGYTAEEALKQSVEKITLPNSLERTMILFAEKMELIESGDPEGWEPAIFEIEQYHKDGSIIWTGNHAKFLPGPDGRPISIVGVTRDITERKQAEYEKEKLKTQLQQAQKMEAIGTLAGGIAHDFNNILSGIFGYSQLAKMHIDDQEKTTKNIDQVIKGAQKATDLVKQILTFSRKSEHTMQPLKIFIEVKEAVKLLRSSIPATIEIKEKINSKATVLADLTQIHQVVMNLCTNAYHAMREKGGVLSVSLEEIQFSNTNNILDLNILPGAYLRLDVSDTGPGISPETLDRIFEPYFTTKEIDEGTGLGLAAVMGIVEEHNGYIKVYSELGKGSTFHVYFPVLEDQIGSNSLQEEQNAIQGGTERIMVVDDEIAILTSTQELLEAYGYTVIAFSDSEQGIKEFKKTPHQYDLIITDMTMPKMTGEEFSVEILKTRTDMPIMLCTGYSQNFTEDKALELGIRKYIQKPVESKNLLVLIREVLDNKQT